MKSALIIVDVQNDFCEGGTLAVKGSNSIIPTINNLANSGKFDLIIVTKDWHPKNHKSFASNHKNKNIYDIIKLNGVTQVLWPDHCIQKSKGARLHANLKLNKKYIIIKKGQNPNVDSYSGFYDNDHKTSTGLTEYLQRKNIEKIFITGLATDYCVKYTALDSVKEGFKTYVIKDAVKGVEVNKGDIKEAFEEMKKSGVKVVLAKSVI